MPRQDSSAATIHIAPGIRWKGWRQGNHGSAGGAFVADRGDAGALTRHAFQSGGESGRELVQQPGLRFDDVVPHGRLDFSFRHDQIPCGFGQRFSM